MFQLPEPPMPIGRIFRRLRGRRRIRAAASVAVVQDGRVLMVREGGGADAGRWNLPGGKVGRGESFLDAAVREAEEEAGYQVETDGLLGVYRYLNRRGQERVRYVFRASVVSGRPRCDGKEITDVRWFALPEALAMRDEQLSKPAVLRGILEELAAGVGPR